MAEIIAHPNLQQFPTEFVFPTSPVIIREHNKDRRTRARDTQFAGLFPDFNPTMLGKALHKGTENRVYEYGADKVIKIPRFLFGISKNTSVMAQTSLDLFQQHLSEYTVPTKVLASPNTPYCLIIQDKIPHMEFLDKKNSGRSRQDLEKIARVNQLLVKEQGLSIDFLGRGGITRLFSRNPCLTNIVTINNPDGSKSLKIIDYGFIKLGNRWYKETNMRSLTSRLRNAIVFGIQQRVMKDAFGLTVA